MKPVQSPGKFFHGSSTPYLLLVSLLLLVGCGDREKDVIEMDKEPGFYCPNDSQITYEGWSEYGLMKVCRSTETGEKNGSQFAAQDGRLRSKSLYSDGQRKGGWTGYDNDGKAMPVDGGYRFPVQAGVINATPTSSHETEDNEGGVAGPEDVLQPSSKP